MRKSAKEKEILKWYNVLGDSMKQKIFYKAIVVILSLMLILTNCGWGFLFLKEQQKLKNPVVPPLTEDYFSTQLTLTKNAQKNGYEINPAGLKAKDNPFHFYEVPLILQNPNYPNGCEAAAAVMLLNYYGISITLQEFIEDYLPTKNVYEENGIRYGPNPAFYYAGDPTSETRGWGCFEPVIVKAMEKVIQNYEKEKNILLEYKFLLTDTKMDLSTYFLYGEPFMIWVTIDYEEATDIYEWFSYDKTNTYTYPKNSHAVVITGMDNEYFYINDPLKTEKNIPVAREKLEKSFDSLGRQKIILKL